MKTRLFSAKSTFSFKENFTRNNQLKDRVINVAEEIGAWMFLGGVAISIFWIAGLLFGGEIG